MRRYIHRYLAVPVVLLCMVLGLSACASKSLPVGYEPLRTEVNLVEASKYIQGLRDAYVSARQQGVLKPDQFLLAVKADQSLTAVWARYLDAVKNQQDSVALWSSVIQSLTTLENLVTVWVPSYSTAKKPVMLGQPVAK